MSEIALTKLKLLQGYKFKVSFDDENIPGFFMDEQKPIGDDSGPDPRRLLSAAVGHCLSSSLIYCLSKARIKVESLETTVKTSMARNEQGLLRVKKIDVDIYLVVDKGDEARVPECLEIFENYCTVTQSVRKGIEVNVNLK
jgi:uncharacterized OsmC-like protein